MLTKRKFNYSNLIFLAAVIFSAILFNAGTVSAASSTPVCGQATAEFIFRNDKGEFIPGLNFELYEQLTNVDGYPAPGKKIAAGKIDPFVGNGIVKFTPKANAQGGYGLMIKVFDKNASVGEFWYPSELFLGCGESKTIRKTISGIHFIFRDGQGKLKRNFKFSLYTQRYDADGKPIKDKRDLVSSVLDTGEAGETTVYVADQSRVLRGAGGDYAVVASPTGEGSFIEYYLHVDAERTANFEYVLSSAVFTLQNAAGETLPKTAVLEIFKQERDGKNKPVLGKSLKKLNPDSAGKVIFEFSIGDYAAGIKDDSGKNYVPFYDLKFQSGQTLTKKLVVPFLRVRARDGAGEPVAIGTAVAVYDLTKDDQGRSFRNKKVADLKILPKGYAEARLAPGGYLFVIKSGKLEYGQGFTVQPGRLQELTIRKIDASLSEAGKPVAIAAAAAGALAEKLKGQILLQVESAGEAWYVRPDTKERVYLKDGDAAYTLMRRLGLGITNADLKKIPIGLNDKIAADDFDTDGDGLGNKLEEAIGTDPFNYDSDGDDASDGAEAAAGTDPLGPGKLPIDTKFAAKLKGKILLQTESKGEAWYVYPKDGKRYYLKDGVSAYQIMRVLSLGITDDNLGQIDEGSME